MNYAYKPFLRPILLLNDLNTYLWLRRYDQPPSDTAQPDSQALCWLLLKLYHSLAVFSNFVFSKWLSFLPTLEFHPVQIQPSHPQNSWLCTLWEQWRFLKIINKFASAKPTVKFLVSKRLAFFTSDQIKSCLSIPHLQPIHLYRGMIITVYVRQRKAIHSTFADVLVQRRDKPRPRLGIGKHLGYSL